MKLLVVLLLQLIVHTNQGKSIKDDALTRKTRNAVFPDGSSEGIFLALAIPIDLPGRSITVSYNYEANYNLPANASQFTNPFGTERVTARRARRSVDRRHAYLSLEEKLESQGLNGRACILRTICETAETNLRHNGLVGDLMHIMFTPSTSRNKRLHPSFNEAERRGANGANCRLVYSKCPVGLLEFVSILDN